ncbi:hypothetical protein ABG067_007871 [Albugo candida]
MPRSENNPIQWSSELWAEHLKFEDEMSVYYERHYKEMSKKLNCSVNDVKDSLQDYIPRNNSAVTPFHVYMRSNPLQAMGKLDKGLRLKKMAEMFKQISEDEKKELEVEAKRQTEEKRTEVLRFDRSKKVKSLIRRFQNQCEHLGVHVYTVCVFTYDAQNGVHYKSFDSSSKGIVLKGLKCCQPFFLSKKF